MTRQSFGVGYDRHGKKVFGLLTIGSRGSHGAIWARVTLVDGTVLSTAEDNYDTQRAGDLALEKAKSVFAGRSIALAAT